MKIEQLVCDGCGKAETKRKPVVGFELRTQGSEDNAFEYEAHEDPACHRRYFSTEAKAEAEHRKANAAKA